MNNKLLVAAAALLTVAVVSVPAMAFGPKASGGGNIPNVEGEAVPATAAPEITQLGPKASGGMGTPGNDAAPPASGAAPAAVLGPKPSGGVYTRG